MRYAARLNTVYSRYLKALFLLLAGGVLATVGFNFSVDPYGIWRTFEFDGLNRYKSERRDANYLFKAADLIRKSPRTLLIGSSRVAFGLNPEYEAFSRLGLGPVYNSALTGGHLYAIRRYLEHAMINHPDIELVIWGVDFFAFSEKVRLPDAFDDNRLLLRHIDLKDAATALASLDSLGASIRTLRSNILEPGYEPYFRNGQLTAMDMARQVRKKGMVSRFDQSLRLYLHGDARLATYTDSADAWNEFERILDLAKRHDVRLIAFVSPVHTALLEAIAQRGHWSTYKSWLKRMAQHTEFWDFAVPQDITSEPITRRMRHYWDVSHYRSSVGNLVLQRLLWESEQASGINGRLVTNATIKSHIDTLENEIAAWRSADSETVEFVARRLDPQRK